MKKEQNLINYGKEVSYLFYSFVKWIIEDCKKKNIKKIYFFTREGEFYNNVAKKINDYAVELNVLEVSRLATFFPSLSDITLDELMRMWNQYSTQSVAAIFKSLGLNIKEYQQYLKKYKLDKEEEIQYPWQDDRIKMLFKDKSFLKLLKDEQKIKREELYKYFHNKDLKNSGETIAIVDIGWRGTIQDNICYLLPKNKIYGYYFGLIDFLNKQPDNSEKYGFLNMFKSGEKYIENVTPFEMVCNSPNGSTIDYLEGKALRKIDENENNSYKKYIQYVQNGILSKIEEFKDNGRNYNKVFKILSKMVYDPNYYIAKSYFELIHNEEFGLGTYVDKSAKISYFDYFLAFVSRKKRNDVRQKLISTSWPQGFTKYCKMNLLNKYFYIKHVKRDDCMVINNDSKLKKIAWFIPKPIKGSGGHRTIIQNANMLVKLGYKCDLYIEEDFVTTSKELKNKIIEYFGECLCDVYVGAVLRSQYDLVFATHAIGTPEFTLASDCSNRAYFIQDFEPWFMPMGDLYISMENSYKYDFKCVSIGRWLAYKLKKEYGREVKYFPFCADLNVYKPLKNVKKENAVCFIFQPEKPRRCCNLGLSALKIVKELRPDTKIYLYGSPDNFYEFEHENLHIISIDECNELFNKCKVGLCISASNPSRTPFEMMASGLAVVDLYKENNLYDMPDEGILLADSTPESIATAIIKLLDDEKLNKKMRDFGIKFMSNYPLEKGFDMFAKSVDDMFKNNYKSDEKITKIYNKELLCVSDEVKKVSHIVRSKPYYKDTSDFTRKLVRIKRKIKGGIGRIFNIFR